MRTWTMGAVVVLAGLAAACGDGPGKLTGDPAGGMAVSAQRGGAGPDLGCGPLVRRHGEAVVVSPSGEEDTATLQCALDLAAAAGRPVTLALAPGEFRTAQLVVTDFDGRLRGAGMGQTTLRNVERKLVVAPDWTGDTHPSAAYPWPALLSLIHGRYTVSDLTIQVVGQETTTDYGYFPVPMMMVAVVGEAAEAGFERVRFVGEHAPANTYFDGNTFNAVSTWEESYFAHPPIALQLSVHGCEFLHGIGSGVNLVNLAGASISIVGNRFVDMGWDAVELIDAVGTDFAFLGNSVEAPGAGVTMYDVCAGPPAVCGMSDSRLLMAGNRIEAHDGFALGSTFGAGMRCAIVGNQVVADAAAAGHGVWLGPGTSGCLVARSGTVLDEGTGNRVVGGP